MPVPPDPVRATPSVPSIPSIRSIPSKPFTRPAWTIRPGAAGPSRCSSGLPLLLLGLAMAAAPVRAELPDPLAGAVLPERGPELRNQSWTDEWEREFQQRADRVIEAEARERGYGGTFFENEKRSYGLAMISVLGGHVEPAMKFLQEEDANADEWNRHTLGIDLYPCFTIKHQMRKLFLFGHLMEDDYRRRMLEAGRLWTEQDPLRRPHYAYEGLSGGWTPRHFNSWVDVRNTDNLRLMRDTSVYLMAEAAGNEEVRDLYRDKLVQFIAGLYHVGMGEWDSENYLGHSIVPLLNLYDFARDPEVAALAKAGIDWMAAAGALKYWRGNYNGPNRRDYNHPVPLRGSAAYLMWQWFGDSPLFPDDHEPDAVHVITSRYRPPAAVVALARKDFERPREIIANKPVWAVSDDWHEAPPEFRETHYFSRSFQFGTLARGTQNPDINGFKILSWCTERGAEQILVAPCSNPLRIGSPQYDDGIMTGRSVVGQNRNIAIYLTEPTDEPYLWIVPESVDVGRHGRVTSLRTERHTIAIWPINSTHPGRDRELTRELQVRRQEDRRSGEITEHPRWPGMQVLRSDRENDGFYGFAIEICEHDDMGSENFIAAARQVNLELDGIDKGGAAFSGVTGPRLRVQWAENWQFRKVWRDGRERVWDDPVQQRAYGPADPDQPLEESLVWQDWQGGELTIRAGGHVFRAGVDEDGQAWFEEE